MSENNGSIYSLLSRPAVYSFIQDVLGGTKARKTLASEHLAAPGLRILDIGCGPGDILQFLPADVYYVGYDGSKPYIDRAVARFGERASFRHELLTPDSVIEQNDFTHVIAMGVLHHMDDETAVRVFEIAKRALRPGGKVITADGCYIPDQAILDRLIISLDRGNNVRTPEEYALLARQVFEHVTVRVRHDLFKVPYSFCILECCSLA